MLLTKFTRGPPELPYCEKQKQKQLYSIHLDGHTVKTVYTDDNVYVYNGYIYNGICLNILHIRVLQAKFMTSSVGSADDTGGHCVLKGKRASHGHYKLSWPQV